MSKPNLRPLFDHEIAKSDADCLIETADCIRQIATDFGLRPYRVFLVWLSWTADEDADGRIGTEPVVREEDQTDLTAFSESDLEDELVGEGRPVLRRELELLPTPSVSPLSGVGKDLDAVGLTERGAVTVSQITMRISEDLLMGLVAPFRDEERPDALKPGIDFFWEVQEHRPAGYLTPGFEGCEDPQERRQTRRRFHVSGVPSREADAFQWSVTLLRADGERGREGEVEEVG